MTIATTTRFVVALVLMPVAIGPDRVSGSELKPIGYNNPGLVVDLGVGLWAWPLPMDFDGDGDNDLVVVCPDKPYNGTYWFENPGGKKRMPVFKAAVRISRGLQNVQLSWVDEKPRVLSPGFEYPDFLKTGLESRIKLPLAPKVGHAGKIRANQWKYVDYDGDGRLDLVVGIGDW
ncbi:MAG: VCBS repeat-containing protein, partial [Planctomycetaceae bacterium]